MIIFTGRATVTINEQSLHNHKKADSEKRIIRTVLKKSAYVVQNLKAKIGTERHHEACLQKLAILRRNLIFPNEKSNDRYNQRHGKLCIILVMARVLQALLHGSAAHQIDVPIPNKESHHQYGQNGIYDFHFYRSFHVSLLTTKLET
jgi:hypothetical protein